jgi:hypothetical protein
MFHFRCARILVLTNFPLLPMFLQFLVSYASKRLEQLFILVSCVCELFRQPAYRNKTKCFLWWANDTKMNYIFMHGLLWTSKSTLDIQKNSGNSLSRFWRKTWQREYTFSNIFQFESNSRNRLQCAHCSGLIFFYFIVSLGAGIAQSV